jgi:hypothetical protein
VEKKKRWEFRKEVSNKKLEISRKWQELRKKQSNKKYEMFQKKYELRKRSLDLEMNKLGEKRHRTRSFENTLYNRLKKIEKSLKLQQTIILGMVAKAMPEIRR